MQQLLNNLLSQVPTTLVLGYFLNQFLKRLEKYIEKTDQLADDVLTIKTELKVRQDVEKEKRHARND